MLAEDMRFLGQRWRTSLLTSAMSFKLLSSPLAPKVPWGQQWGARPCYTRSRFVLRLRDPELRESKSLTWVWAHLFVLCSRERHLLYWTGRQPALCFRSRRCLCPPQLFAIPASLKRQPRTKTISASTGKMCRSVRNLWRMAYQHPLNNSGVTHFSHRKWTQG